MTFAEVIYTTTQFYKETLATCDVINYELNRRWRHVMDEEQCHRPSKDGNMRPPRGVRVKEDYRQVGQDMR